MSLISAITSKGRMRFMVKEKGGLNADVFIEFLNRQLVGETREIFLILEAPRIGRKRRKPSSKRWQAG
jgi:hypothetical protein